MKIKDSRFEKELDTGNTQVESKKKRKVHRKRNAWHYMLLGSFFVCISIVIYLFIHPTIVDGFKRNFTYQKMDSDSNGNLPLYSFSFDQSTVYGEMNGILLLASQSKIILLEENGNEIYSTSVALLHPTVIHNEKYALCFDEGSKSIFLFSKQGLLYEKTMDGEILDAYLSEDGNIVVTYNKSGYKSCVTVLNKRGEIRFEFNSSDRFVMSSCCSPKHKILASITLGQNNGQFISYVVLYKTNETEAFATIPIQGTLIYDVSYLDGSFCCVGENALYFVSTSGELQNNYSYGTRYLRNCSLEGNDYVTLYLSDYKAGSQGLLLTIDKRGNEIGGFQVDNEVLCVSSSGNYVGLLDNTRVTVFDKELNRIATQESIASVESINTRSDGTVVLISTSKGTLFVP